MEKKVFIIKIYKKLTKIICKIFKNNDILLYEIYWSKYEKVVINLFNVGIV